MSKEKDLKELGFSVLRHKEWDREIFIAMVDIGSEYLGSSMDCQIHAVDCHDADGNPSIYDPEFFPLILSGYLKWDSCTHIYFNFLISNDGDLPTQPPEKGGLMYQHICGEHNHAEFAMLHPFLVELSRHYITGYDRDIDGDDPVMNDMIELMYKHYEIVHIEKPKEYLDYEFLQELYRR